MGNTGKYSGTTKLVASPDTVACPDTVASPGTTKLIASPKAVASPETVASLGVAQEQRGRHDETKYEPHAPTDYSILKDEGNSTMNSD